MKIGVISDTHDHIPAIQKAFQHFEAQGIQTVLHLGDIISPFVIRFIREVYSGQLLAVFGNNDGERLFLREMFQKYNAEIQMGPRILTIAGRRIIMMHEPVAPEVLAHAFDLVLYGHLHEIRNEKHSHARILNPGEACGYLSGKRTFAIVDLSTLQAEIIEF